MPNDSAIRGRVTGKISIKLNGKNPELPKPDKAVPTLFSSSLKDVKENINQEIRIPTPIMMTAASRKTGLFIMASASDLDIFIKRYIGNDTRTTKLLKVVKKLSPHPPNRFRTKPIAIRVNSCRTV